MGNPNATLVSFVIPLYNESQGLESFNKDLVKVIKNSQLETYEIIYCDDGSTDNTANVARSLCKNNPNIKLLKLSRNFGKENTLSAGIIQAKGQAVVTLDGDNQHPLDLIPEFIKAWQDGVKVVVGIRQNIARKSLLKRFGTKLFYNLFNKLTEQKLMVGSSDYRLIDKTVREEFIKLPESDRITRGLVDWLGFKTKYISFKAQDRAHGAPGYSYLKLFRLARDSFTSLNPAPLYVFGYVGVFITIASFLLGAAVFIEQPLLGDRWHWKFSGTAMLGILILFLVGIVLTSQGILSLYISYILKQSQRRPLFVIDYEQSIGIDK